MLPDAPVDQKLLNKLLLRVLTDDETVAVAARNVLVAKLRASGCDLERDVTLIQDGYAHRTIQRLTAQVDGFTEVSGWGLFLEAVYQKCATDGVLMPGWQTFLKQTCGLDDNELADHLMGRSLPQISAIEKLKGAVWRTPAPTVAESPAPITVAPVSGRKRTKSPLSGRKPGAETVQIRERVESIVRESGPAGMQRALIDRMVYAEAKPIGDAIYYLAKSQIIFPINRNPGSRSFTYVHYFFKKQYPEAWEKNRQFALSNLRGRQSRAMQAE